ncbi:MAG: BON domain-containing protein [Acidobacteriota bacterium]
MKFKLFTLTAGTIAAAAIFSACGSPAANVNVNATRTNANVMNANSNVAVLVNNNSAMANSNRWANTNSVTREDYNKNRADYEKEKGTSTIGTGANDSWIWFKTRAALMTTNDLRESTVDVDVTNDVVTLRGTVGSAAEKTKAEQVAKGIDGVKSVKNDLKVSANDSMTNTGGSSNNSNSNKK